MYVNTRRIYLIKDSDIVQADEFRVIYLVCHKFGLSFLPGCDLPVFNGIIILLGLTNARYNILIKKTCIQPSLLR